jgi:hypothetical protein
MPPIQKSAAVQGSMARAGMADVTVIAAATSNAFAENAFAMSRPRIPGANMRLRH